MSQGLLYVWGLIVTKVRSQVHVETGIEPCKWPHDTNLARGKGGMLTLVVIAVILDVAGPSHHQHCKGVESTLRGMEDQDSQCSRPDLLTKEHLSARGLCTWNVAQSQLVLAIGWPVCSGLSTFDGYCTLTVMP